MPDDSLEVPRPKIQILRTEPLRPPSAKEKATEHPPVILSEEIMYDLERRTKEAALSDDDPEFGLFLLGKEGQAELAVKWGIGHKGGVIEDEQETLALIESYRERGYDVIADYHVHPQRTIREYTLKRFPSAYAASPSTGDISDKSLARFQRLGVKVPFPRIIGIYDERNDTVIMSAFVPLKPVPHTVELQPFEFESLIAVKSPDDSLVKLEPPVFTDPRELIARGFIAPIAITVTSSNGVEERQNPLTIGSGS